MILVTGATGNVGSKVVRYLQQVGEQVRILTRNPEKINFPFFIDVFRGDLTAPEELHGALDGVEKLYLIRVPGSDRFLQIVKEAGVQTIVFLSSSAIDAKTENAIGLSHLQIEERIKRTGVNFTFIRPGAFMSNTLQWAKSIQTEGVVRAPYGDVGTAPVDPLDIAAVAAAVLTSSKYHGQICTLTGPDVLTPAEQVKILSEILGKKIRFENVPGEIAKENMKKFAPAEIVEALFTLMEDQKNRPAQTTDTVEQITGQHARSFKQWAIDNAEFFK